MTMKLLLRENVKNLGHAGDVVAVTEGYGRNYLLPRKMAVEVTPANLKALEAEQKRRHARELERIKDFQALAARIAATDITLKERVSDGDTLYGAVSAKQIAASLADEGIGIDAEMVRIEEPVKTIGVHRVPIRLHAEVEATLRIWVVGVKDKEADTPR